MASAADAPSILGLPERSGGLVGFVESWRLGSSGRMRAKKGGN